MSKRQMTPDGTLSMLLKLFASLVVWGTLASGVPAYGGETRFKSDWIGVVSCQKIETVKDRKTKIARFWCVCTLQGCPAETVPVHIQQTTKLPAINSKWIVFVPNAISQNGAFYTSEGKTGQLPYTFNNLKSTIIGMEKQDPGRTFSPELQKNIHKLIESWQPGTGDQASHWSATSTK